MKNLKNLAVLMTSIAVLGSASSAMADGSCDGVLIKCRITTTSWAAGACPTTTKKTTAQPMASSSSTVTSTQSAPTGCCTETWVCNGVTSTLPFNTVSEGLCKQLAGTNATICVHPTPVADASIISQILKADSSNATFFVNGAPAPGTATGGITLQVPSAQGLK